jgi:hypothetical protein
MLPSATITITTTINITIAITITITITVTIITTTTTTTTTTTSNPFPLQVLSASSRALVSHISTSSPFSRFIFCISCRGTDRLQWSRHVRLPSCTTLL